MSPVVVRPPRTRIVHATIKYPEGHGDTKTIHGLGFRAECECGTTFRVRASVRMAQADLNNHPCTMRPPKEG